MWLTMYVRKWVCDAVRSLEAWASGINRQTAPKAVEAPPGPKRMID